MQKKRCSIALWTGVALLAGTAAGFLLWLTAGAETAAQMAGTYLKPLGDLFIRLLKLVVVPVVLLSLIHGLISMEDIRKLGSIGWKTLAFFLGTTAVACVIGLAVATAFRPWFPVLAPAGSGSYEAPQAAGLSGVLSGIVPENLWAALSGGNMLQVIFLALLLGAGILAAGREGEAAAGLAASCQAVALQVMQMIIRLSPVGVFCLMAWVVAAQGPAVLTSLAVVLGAAYAAFLLHGAVVYSLTVKLFARMSPRRFFRGIFPACVFAFSSASSVAALPISRQCCDRLDCDGGVSSFVLPLGATIHMDGTVIYQSVAAVFLARCMGMELGIRDMALIVVTATLASIGTAGVAGSGMVMLAMVLETVGVDPTYIGLIYGVDRIFDMGRTTLNVAGDTACAVCVSRWEGRPKRRGGAEDAGEHPA